MSHGMLASAKELVFGDDHSGIVEIDVEAQPGALLADAYELDDYLLDIENKSLTHRPDCFGLIGFAREVAAIQGKDFTSPKWFTALEPVLGELAESQSVKTPTVHIEGRDIAARYQVVVMTGVDSRRQSPLLIKSYLARSGMRPISAVVDITNYLMLVTGQPLHAFDYDKFVAQSSTDAPDVTVRTGRQGETLELLDGRTITLSEDDIVIAAGATPVALAGAMGGSTTEVDESTANVMIESATFDLYRLRNTQMRHGIFSEAITRFTKGQPAAQTAPVLASCVRMMADMAGAQRASELIDVYPLIHRPAVIELPVEKVNQVLGTDTSIKTATDILARVEIGIDVDPPDTIKATPPAWREDLRIPEDLIEEIGRINGYDTIVPTLPGRTLRATDIQAIDKFIFGLRRQLARAGANELLTYSFVSERLLRVANQQPEQAFRITNALSQDLQYYRLSLTPSLLEKVHGNVKAGYSTFALYEINKTHNKLHTDLDPPPEFSMLALTLVDASKKQAEKGSPLFGARRYLDHIASSLGLAFVYQPITTELDVPAAKPFDYSRSALVVDKITGKMLGIVGEYKQAVQRSLKLPAYSAGFEIGIKELFDVMPNRPAYQPLSRYQGTERDMSFRVTNEVTYQSLVDSIDSQLSLIDHLQTTLRPVSAYQPSDQPGYKHITISISLIGTRRTLTAEEANRIVATIAHVAKQKIGAELV